MVGTHEVGRHGDTLIDHNVTFPPWIPSIDLIVRAPVDSVVEPGVNTLTANLRCSNSRPYTCGAPRTVLVEINDAPQDSQFVSVSASATSIVEGGSATLTFTRTGGSATQDLTVDLRVTTPRTASGAITGTRRP